MALREQLGFCSTYIDDVIVYSCTFEQHLEHIDAILSALKAAGLTANPEKSVWGARFLEYLGHEVGLGKVGVPEARVKALMDFLRGQLGKGISGHFWKLSVITEGLSLAMLSGQTP